MSASDDDVEACGETDVGHRERTTADGRLDAVHIDGGRTGDRAAHGDGVAAEGRQLGRRRGDGDRGSGGDTRQGHRDRSAEGLAIGIGAGDGDAVRALLRQLDSSREHAVRHARRHAVDQHAGGATIAADQSGRRGGDDRAIGRIEAAESAAGALLRPNEDRELQTRLVSCCVGGNRDRGVTAVRDHRRGRRHGHSVDLQRRARRRRGDAADCSVARSDRECDAAGEMRAVVDRLTGGQDLDGRRRQIGRHMNYGG